MNIQILLIVQEPIKKQTLSAIMRNLPGIVSIDSPDTCEAIFDFCMHNPDTIILYDDPNSIVSISNLGDFLTSHGLKYHMVLLTENDAPSNLYQENFSAPIHIIHKKDVLEKLIPLLISFLDIHENVVETSLENHTTTANAVFVLSTREIEILHLVGNGKSNTHIARRLDISKGTVKNHMVNIYKKLHLNSRAEAVVWAWKNGIISSTE